MAARRSGRQQGASGTPRTRSAIPGPAAPAPTPRAPAQKAVPPQRQPGSNGEVAALRQELEVERNARAKLERELELKNEDLELKHQSIQGLNERLNYMEEDRDKWKAIVKTHGLGS